MLSQTHVCLINDVEKNGLLLMFTKESKFTWVLNVSNVAWATFSYS